MKKFENKQKVVSKWRKLLLVPRAEYIHKFMFHFSSFCNFGSKKLQPSTSITACTRGSGSDLVT